MICRGPSNERFQSRLLLLLDQQGLAPLNFLSIRLEKLIWVKFQIEGPAVRIARLRAKIMGLARADLHCDSHSIASLLPKEVLEGIMSLGIAVASPNRQERKVPTFRGLQ